eukprot:TRINITY_DN29181_c0_g1_i2.p2 TRINITY_DN29181_c0_g1~~TRINITY_DN29181_c0_g1_i2.p2  ORF type:complete len:204 (-),score=20.17 TRINITY_DN29181_c0_g1_i2:251-862(-)
MSEILKGYARESLYFKREQEADLYQHYKKLVNAGKLPKKLPEQLLGKTILRTQQEEEAATKVLFEVLQQQTRLNDPHAHKRRDIRVRGKAFPPPLSAKVQSQLQSGFNSKEVINQLKSSFDPKLFSMKSTWSTAELADNLLLAKDTAQLHAVDIGQRQCAAAFRVMTYASALSILGMGILVTIGAYTTGVFKDRKFPQKYQSQ